jgi:hypothetical protein
MAGAVARTSLLSFYPWLLFRLVTFPLITVNERVKEPASLCRKELMLLWCTGANARFWESSRFDCSKVTGRIRPFGVESTSLLLIATHAVHPGIHECRKTSAGDV